MIPTHNHLSFNLSIFIQVHISFIYFLVSGRTMLFTLGVTFSETTRMRCRRFLAFTFWIVWEGVYIHIGGVLFWSLSSQSAYLANEYWIFVLPFSPTKTRGLINRKLSYLDIRGY